MESKLEQNLSLGPLCYKKEGFYAQAIQIHSEYHISHKS